MRLNFFLFQKSLIGKAVSALRKRAGKIRPASLTLLQEGEREGQELRQRQATTAAGVIHHRLQTDTTKHIVDAENAGNLEMGGAGEGSCNCRAYEVGGARGGYDSCVVTMDTACCAVEATPTMCHINLSPASKTTPTWTRPLPPNISLLPPGEETTSFDFNSCIPPGTRNPVDIPGYIPMTTINTSSDNSN